MKHEQEFLHILKQAIREDHSAENIDITSDIIFSQNETTHAQLLARQNGIVAGLDYFCAVFSYFDPNTCFTPHYDNGAYVTTNTCIIEIEAQTRALLRAERIALNLLGFMSGIATETAQLVTIAQKYGATRILDTRKTIPSYRLLSKEAVVLGGGTNHRMGLYDMVMIKDNHIAAAGGIANAVNAIRQKWHNQYKIEVECSTYEEVSQAVQLNVDVIMLDNMSLAECQTIIKRYGAICKFEASGDMDKEKIKQFSRIGVDFISVGRITHSAPNFNVSLKI